MLRLRLVMSKSFMETVLKIVSCDCVHSLDDILPAGLIEAIIAQVTCCTSKTSGRHPCVLSYSVKPIV